MDSERQAVEEKLAEVLRSTSSMYVATTGAPDSIWNAGAFFAELDPFTLTLVLETGGRTLANIRANPNVAVVINPAGPFAPFVQGRAVAEVRSEADKQETIDALVSKDPASEPLITAAPVEAMLLRMTDWRVTDVPNGWLPGKVVEPALG